MRTVGKQLHRIASLSALPAPPPIRQYLQSFFLCKASTFSDTNPLEEGILRRNWFDETPLTWRRGKKLIVLKGIGTSSKKLFNILLNSDLRQNAPPWSFLQQKVMGEYLKRINYDTLNDPVLQTQWAEKKWVWLTDKDNGYLAASTVKEMDDQIEVQLDDNTVTVS
jgi:Myosin N-terminal SH3-like domain